MENLWAPWRMDYIHPKKKQSGCLLCRIAKDKARDRKNLVFLRTKTAFAVLNKFPYNNGHIMICPNTHKRHLKQLREQEILELFNLVTKTQGLLDKALKPAGYNIGINLGSYAGAGIDKHLHIHIVPRWMGDTNFMPVTAKTKVIPQSLNSLLKKLRKNAKGI